MSHLGNIQAAPLYPLKWPFAWMELHRAWQSIIALHVALLAVGMYWLVRRRLGLMPPAALIAVVAVVGSGAVMVRMLFFEQILVLAWAPWLLGSIDAVVRRGPNDPHRSIAGLALVTAALLCAGHPQVVYVMVPLAALWMIGRALDHRGPPPTGRSLLRAVGGVMVGVAVGVFAAAPQLLPAAQLAGRSANTGGRDLATVSTPGYSLQLRRLPGTWLGDPLAKVHSVTSAGYENLTFVGTVTTLAALIACFAARRTGRSWTTAALMSVIAGSVLLGIGPRLFFFRAAFEIVPGFDEARVPARWTLAAVVAVGVAASFGVDAIASATAAPTPTASGGCARRFQRALSSSSDRSTTPVPPP